ncbi:MAG: two-component system sensor kinase FixL [Gammaproteobacteria bacterium]
MPTISEKYLQATHDNRRDAEPRLHALLDAAIDAIITIDQHGIIDSINPATLRMFGYSTDELLGSNVNMLMPSPDHERHDGYLQRYLMTGEAHIIGLGREIEGRRKDGSVFPADLAVSEFKAEGERMFTGLVRDISDRRSAEHAAQRRLEELAHAGRLADLGMATSTIAHEVNQPLTAIVSFAHACQRILESDNADPTVVREALGQIAEQAERASAIVDRIRGMAKKRDSSSEQIDLNAAVSNVLTILGRQLRDCEVRVSTQLENDLPIVIADSVQVEQIVMNLVLNAIDAMRSELPDTRALEVSTTHENGTVRLCVQDTGPGISKEEAERIFDSFYSTKIDGMGVGLSICRSLAESHNGQLWVEPRSNDDRGATFHLEFPGELSQSG